ncbi:MAG: hypothetical protein ACLR8L_14825 [Oscillospiraceae bacterium]
MTATLARSMGNFTELAALMAAVNSEALFTMNISGLRTLVAAISTPFADNVPSTSPIGIPIPQRIKSCKKQDDRSALALHRLREAFPYSLMRFVMEILRML